MSRSIYILNVTYVGFFSNNTDIKFEKILGKQVDGSGYGYGRRDISFWYGTKKAMLSARRKIYRAKAKGIKLPKYVMEISHFTTL